MKWSTSTSILIIAFSFFMRTTMATEIPSSHSSLPKEAIELFENLGMPSENKGSLKKINAWAQQSLLRKNHRWSTQERVFSVSDQAIFTTLDKIGFTSEVSPKLKDYEAVIVHGASLPSVVKRLKYVNKIWDQGVRFEKIIFLTSHRPIYSIDAHDNLFPQEEKPDEVATEADMMQWVWKLIAASEDLQKLEVVVIAAPMEMAKAEGKPFPNTNHTAITLRESKIKPGNYLAVSNAPYIFRQGLILKNALKGQAIDVETVGPGKQTHLKTVIALDELARYIYELSKTPSVAKIE